MFLKCALVSLLVFGNIDKFRSEGSYEIENKIQFPFGGPFMGMFVALALPLNLPNYDVSLSYNFEASFPLPENQTNFTYPPLIADRAFSRETLYSILERKLAQNGMSGKECLLRTICEASLYPFKDTGVLGDLFHILLTPSTSKNSNLTMDYQKAENIGKRGKSCKKFNKQCPVSLMNMFSKLENFFEIITSINK